MNEFVGLTLTDVSKLMISSIPIGFLAGGIPFLIGLTVSGIVKIFKRV
jgi:hypothetical protein